MKNEFTLSKVHPEPVEGKCYPLPVLFLVSCGEHCRTIVSVFVLVFVLTGCGTMKQVQVVREVSRDTLYLSNVQYDSIYVFQDHLTDRSRDTIYIRDVQYEYKYKLLRDTIYRTQIDTIPVISEVEVVKTERYIPKVYKASLCICVIIIICAICAFIMKFK